MQRTLLKSKLHGATITDKQLYYDGSITLDANLLQAADLLAGEQVQVLNVNNGQRFVTYTIAAPAGSGTVMLNGPAARLGEVGDIIIVLSYARYDETEAANHRPVIVHADAKNRPDDGSNHQQ